MPEEALQAESGDAGPAATERVFHFGEVVFQAHFGMLSVQLSRLQVHLQGTGGELTVSDPESEEGGRLTLVTFTAAGPGVRDGAQYWAADDVKLTEAGVSLFGDVYPSDEPFAPLMIPIPTPSSAS